MSYDTHNHFGNRIFRRSKIEPADKLWVELEEGSRATHLEIPIRLREPFGKKLLGHINVKATVQGNASSIKYLPRQVGESLKELLIRSNVEIIQKKGKGENQEPDYEASILKELSSRYPEKSSVKWYTFYIFSPPYEIKEEPDFEMHDHKGPIVVLPDDFIKIKEGEVGVTLAQGFRPFDYEEDTKVINISHKQIGTALVLLSIQTRINYIGDLMPIFNLPKMIFKAERWPATIVRRQLSILYGKKSDAKWFSLIYFLPKEIYIFNQE